MHIDEEGHLHPDEEYGDEGEGSERHNDEEDNDELAWNERSKMIPHNVQPAPIDELFNKFEPDMGIDPMERRDRLMATRIQLAKEVNTCLDLVGSHHHGICFRVDTHGGFSINSLIKSIRSSGYCAMFEMSEFHYFECDKHKILLVYIDAESG